MWLHCHQCAEAQGSSCCGTGALAMSSSLWGLCGHITIVVVQGHRAHIVIAMPEPWAHIIVIVRLFAHIITTQGLGACVFPHCLVLCMGKETGGIPVLSSLCGGSVPTFSCVPCVHVTPFACGGACLHVPCLVLSGVR